MIQYYIITCLILSTLAMVYYFYYSIKWNDAVCLYLMLLYGLCSIEWTTLLKMYRNDDNRFVIYFCLIITTIIFLYTIFFAKKNLEKQFDQDIAWSLLEDTNINSEEFKKLSRTEQVEMLKSAIWLDEPQSLLIEDEEDLDDFKCILNKK